MQHRHWAFSALGTLLLGLPAHAQQQQHARGQDEEQQAEQPGQGQQPAKWARPVQLPPPLMQVPPPIQLLPPAPAMPPAPPAPPAPGTVFVPPPPPRPIFVPPPAPPLPIATTPLPAKLQGSSVYVYSFLDVRQNEYTSKVLDQFDADLTARLSGLTIGSNILRFRNSKMNRADEFYAGSQNLESRAVPVMETVYSNLREERGTHARFRLIVFPSSYTVSGAWRFYEIRFILMDAETGARLWSYDYSGKHMVMMKNSENAEGRSKKILDKLFVELKAAGYL